jgi:hypothetical protein
LTSALEGGGWSAPRPGRFTPGKDPVLIVQEAEYLNKSDVICTHAVKSKLESINLNILFDR